ncbi:SEL1-like repeat protein [Pseudomonas sp. PB3P13]
MYRILLLSILLQVGCGISGVAHSKKDSALDPLSHIKTSLAFTCVYERIPEASADADVLFHYARWLQKNNQLKQDKIVDAEIERLYRIAAENGHHKANINLQNGALRGHFKLRGEEHLRLSQELIDAGVATGYYFVGIYLKQGSAGLQKDPEMALRYFRKAADEGNANAQAYIGDKLAPIDIAPNIARQMRQCAASQGQSEAAVMLFMYLRDDKKYSEAVEVLQMAVASGDENAAGRLSDSFRGPSPDNQVDYLELQPDVVRADRYKQIWRILANYSYANPKVPEINEIVPLPPVELPPWDGKLKWLEEREANIPPPKPSETLIQQMAKAKVLDPVTGRPMPGSPAFIKATTPAPTCQSGQACPHAGYWQASRLTDASQASLQGGTIRHFEEGEILPLQSVERHHRRFLRADITTIEDEIVEWRLLG